MKKIVKILINIILTCLELFFCLLYFIVLNFIAIIWEFKTIKWKEVFFIRNNMSTYYKTKDENPKQTFLRYYKLRKNIDYIAFSFSIILITSIYLILL